MAKVWEYGKGWREVPTCPWCGIEIDDDEKSYRVDDGMVLHYDCAAEIYRIINGDDA